MNIAAFTESNKRTMERLQVRIVVQDSLRSASLGTTSDMSIDGFFLATDVVLPVGSMLPVGLTLGEFGELRASAEVMRHADGGMGMRFAKLSTEDRRKLRKFLARLTTIGAQRETVERLNDAGTRTTTPVTDQGQIVRRLTEASQLAVEVRLIPPERPTMDVGRLRQVQPTGLVLTLTSAPTVQVGEPVLALLTLDFVSYSFEAQVEALDDRTLRLSMPAQLVFSERRQSGRREAPPNTLLRLPAPWLPTGMLEWQVVDVSPGGVGLITHELGAQLFPGTPLEGASLVIDGRPEPLQNAVVRNVIRREESDGVPTLRIGVACGPRRRVLADTALSGGSRPSNVLWRRVVSFFRNLRDGVSLLWHSRAARAVGVSREGSGGPQVVRFSGSRGLRIAALMNRAFDDTEVPNCPVVVVVPGFAGRKEQTSYLAHQLIDHFRRQHRDLVVIRLDGTNNLGESDKAPGCHVEGKQTLNYTCSGVAEDLMDCLEWLRRGEVVRATDVSVVSVSFGSLGVRQLLASGRAPEVRRWVAWMGAADARDAVLHVSGHFDVVAAGQAAQSAGVRMGQVTLVGCLVDAQRFYDDLVEHDSGTLDDARRDLASIRADVLWMRGTHDAWMDPRRIGDIMGVASAGQRQVLSAESGHVPRTGDEAIRQFAEITTWLERGIVGSTSQVRPPSLGWLETHSRLEWQRVRRSMPSNAAEWWGEYLLDDRGPGFDILQRSPAYTSFMQRQADLAQVQGLRVLELGAGTGNMSARLVQAQPSQLVITDLVPEAVQRIQDRYASLDHVKVQVLDIDGGPWLALDRFRRGELEDFGALVRRLPGAPADFAERANVLDRQALHALARGYDVHLDDLRMASNSPPELREVLQELALVARMAAEPFPDLSTLGTLQWLRPGPPDRRRGLPFASGQFDRVVMSLVLSYLEEPHDALSEIWRVLAPGGTLVMSTLRRDADSSGIFLSLIDQLERAPEAEVGDEATRADLIAAARRFLDRASDLFRLEEEGVYRFWDASEFTRLARLAGFERCHTELGFGEPAQGVILVAHKPAS
jgi:ubiquinone/menaquinone biosynthesis C-methylase UbiE